MEKIRYDHANRRGRLTHSRSMGTPSRNVIPSQSSASLLFLTNVRKNKAVTIPPIPDLQFSIPPITTGTYTDQIEQCESSHVKGSESCMDQVKIQKTCQESFLTSDNSSNRAGEAEATDRERNGSSVSEVKPVHFVRSPSMQQEENLTRGCYPGGYVPQRKRLPQVSGNKSKNDMSVSNRPGKPNEFWGDPTTIINLMESVCENFDDWEDLVNVRRCCSTFASIGVQNLRKKFACRITKRFALYFWQTFKDYPPEEIPYTMYQLTPRWIIKSPVDMTAEESNSADTDEIMQNILRIIGHHLTLLRLEECFITGGLSTLRNLLFEYAPYMTEIIFIQPDFVQNQIFRREINDNGGQFFHGDVGTYIPKLSEPSTSLSYPSRFLLTRFEYHAKTNSWFPLQWAEVFARFPKLKELSLKNLRALEMTEAIAALTSDFVESTLPLQKLNMFYTSVYSDIDENCLVTRLLPLYQQLPFKLTELDIHLKLSLDVNQIQEILTRFSESLISLTLTREPGMSNFPFITLFNHQCFPSLIFFQCTNDILNSFNFLNAMTGLEQLKMCQTDPTERYPSTTLFSRLFERTNFQVLGKVNLKSLYLSKCLDFPATTATPDVKLEQLKNSFHDLRTLHIRSIDNAGIRTIFGQLSTVRELTIAGPNLGVTDEGIIGFDGNRKIERFIAKMEELEELNKKRLNTDFEERKLVIRRDFPYVGDLLYLRSFVIDNDYRSINVTNLSLNYGFEDCDLLNNLELYGTMVSDDDVKNWNHPPSIVAVSVSKNSENRFVGLAPKSERD